MQKWEVSRYVENRQVWPWSTEETGQRLTSFAKRMHCTGHSKHPLATTQEITLYVDVTRWSILKSD